MFDHLPRLIQSPLAPYMRQVPPELCNFCDRYFENGIKLQPPQLGILHQARLGTLATSVVLYREGVHQVELITFAPDTTIPSHRHDHIDSIEVMVSGGQFCARRLDQS